MFLFLSSSPLRCIDSTRNRTGLPKRLRYGDQQLGDPCVRQRALGYQELVMTAVRIHDSAACTRDRRLVYRERRSDEGVIGPSWNDCVCVPAVEYSLAL